MAAANKVAETTDEIDKASRRAGTSAEEWQKLNYAFGQSGIESTKLEQTMIRNQRSLNDAAEGSKTASEAYEKLGVSIKDADGNLRNSDEVYQDVLGNLADLEDKNLRNSIANDIFGKSYGDLAPILDSGSEGIKDLTDRAVELGLVLSQDTVDAGVVFGDTMSDMKQVGGAVFNMLAAEFIPILQKLLDWVMSHMPEIKEFIGKAFDAITVAVDIASKAFNAILPIFTTLYDWISPYFPTIQNIFETTFKGIGETVESVTEIFWGIVDAVKAAIEWIKSFNKEDKRGEDFEFSQNVSKGDGNKGSRNRVSGSHASGLAYVPYDGYVAEVHKGEEIVKAQDKQSILDILKTLTLNNNQSSQKVELVVNLDGRTLARELYDPMQNENKLRGTNIAMGVL